MRKLAVVMTGLLLGGCATFAEGTSQSVSVDTWPAGATCRVTRYGEQLGTIASTPGSTRIDKSKADIGFTCSKPGFQTAYITVTPTFKETTLISNWGPVGLGVDAMSGANYAYPDLVRLNLAPSAALAMVSQYPVAAPWAVSPEMDRR